VKDQFGNPMPGVPVAFAVPSGYMSFASSGAASMTATTDANGNAVSGMIRAGWNTGTFHASATIVVPSGQGPVAPYVLSVIL
jgi:hypothetical protein